MTVTQVLGWMQVIQIAAQTAIATEQDVAAWIKAKHGSTMTDAEINAALALIQSDAARRLALATADATPPTTGA